MRATSGRGPSAGTSAHVPRALRSNMREMAGSPHKSAPGLIRTPIQPVRQLRPGVCSDVRGFVLGASVSVPVLPGSLQGGLSSELSSNHCSGLRPTCRTSSPVFTG